MLDRTQKNALKWAGWMMLGSLLVFSIGAIAMDLINLILN